MRLEGSNCGKKESIFERMRRRLWSKRRTISDDYVFRLGDQVIKTGGDYKYQGEIVGIVHKKSGQIRYVVEDDRGLLMIMSIGQIIKIKHKPEEYV